MSNDIFTFRDLSQDELNTFQKDHFSRIFNNRCNDGSGNIISPETLKLISLRKHQPWTLNVGIFLNNQIIGWHTGFASDAESYYMKNSAILEMYRNKGAYSALLNYVLIRLEQEGFQVVTSLHHPNNAPVIIPKLKKGFIISGTQFHERFRFLIEMKLFFNEERRKSYGKSMGLEL